MMEALTFSIVALALALPALASSVLSSFDWRAAQSSKTDSESECSSNIDAGSSAVVIPVTFVQGESDMDAASSTVPPTTAARTRHGRRAARRRAS